MQTILFYLLKVIICSGILLLYYWIALRNKQFHYYNRFYLLISIAISIVLPVLHLQWFSFQSSNEKAIALMGVIYAGEMESITINASGFYINWQTILLMAAIAFSMAMLLHLLLRVLKIYKLKRLYPVRKMETFDFVDTDLEQAPFSFLNNLFWRSNIDISETTGKQILQHELAHISQKHTWDKLFMQTTLCFFWINPIYWLMRKELYLVHEFIDDEKAVHDKDAGAFAAMLLHSQYGKNIFAPAQSFFYSPIKRRLLMLTTSKEPRYSYLRRMMVLPLLAFTVLLFAFRLQIQNTDNITGVHVNSPFKLAVDAGHGGNDNGAIGINGLFEKNITLTIAEKIKELSGDYGIDVVLTRASDATIGLEARGAYIKEQNADACISIHANNVAGFPEKITKESKEANGMDIYISRNNDNGLLSQSRLLGSGILQNISSNFTIRPALLQRQSAGIWILDKNTVPAILIECGYMSNGSDIALMTSVDKVELLSRKILEGVVAYANQRTENTALFNMQVTANANDTTPIKLSGKVVGNDISIYNFQLTADTVNYKSIDASEWGKSMGNVTINTPGKDAPIYVVDGNMITSSQLQLFIAANSINTINILKGKEAINKYGAKAQNGVVEIIRKNKGANEAEETTIFSPPAISKDEQLKDEDVLFTPPKIVKDMPEYEVVSFSPPIIIKDDTALYLSEFKAVQIEAKFPGGIDAWGKYLERNLQTALLLKAKAPAGSYRVIVSFLVDADGNLSEVKALNDPGFGAAAEAVRVIQRGPKWTPAIQNGKKVLCKQKQMITFNVS